MKGSGKRYIGLALHKHYLIALGLNEELNIAQPALAMLGDREPCFEAGATEYMSKLVSLKKLVHIINEMLEG